MVVGIIALAWPSVTVLALVIVFAVYAFVAAGLQAARAFSSRKAGPVPGHLLLGLFNLIAGIWMLVQGIELRRTGKTLPPAHSPQREKNPGLSQAKPIAGLAHCH